MIGNKTRPVAEGLAEMGRSPTWGMGNWMDGWMG